MNRSDIAQRLAKLEEASGSDVPLWVRHWLGETLTSDDQDRARVEWAHLRALPAPDPATFPRELRAWLAER